ncbi:MAG: hypothetical protein HYZ42_04120 [Bacteroidetes bacterium]|nr:hypothetical protein [Bacteroidota bacterium]
MMKKIILISTIVFTMMILGACNKPSDNNEKPNTSQIFNLDTTKLKNGDVFYQCEMDPEVISDKPGNCPKCEMELSEMKKK